MHCVPAILLNFGRGARRSLNAYCRCVAAKPEHMGSSASSPKPSNSKLHLSTAVCLLKTMAFGQLFRSPDLAPLVAELWEGSHLYKSWRCVCVCQPLCLRAWIHLMQGRVTLFSYHTQRSCGEEWEGKLGQFPVPATQLLIKPFHFLLFVSWRFMILPLNHFLPSRGAAAPR